MARESQLPPQDTRAEEALLGAVLLAAPTVLPDCVGLSADAFVDPTHREMWRSIRVLDIAGLPIDAVTVSAEMRHRGIRFDDGYLLDVQAHTPSTSTARNYAQIISELWHRRTIIMLAASESAAAIDGRDAATWVSSLAELTATGGSTAANVERMRGRLLTRAQLDKVPAPTWLIDGFAPVGSLGMLFGPSGVGKSFVAVAMAHAVATGTRFLDKETVGGPVLYVAAEGVSGMRSRVAAIEEWTHAPASNLIVHRGAINLLDPSEMAALAAIIPEYGIVFVVIDTLFRCMPGADETRAVEVAPIISGLDSIRETTGATIQLVHHSGKDPTRGARGSTALRGAVDYEVEMSDESTLKVSKQKDAPDGWSIGVARKSVGESLALVAAGGSRSDPASDNIAMLRTLEILREIADVNGVPSSWWQKACEDAGITTRSYLRHRKMLTETRPPLVRNVGTSKQQRWVPGELIDPT